MACTATEASDDASLLVQITSDTVHYNPFDLSAWPNSMLSELNAPIPPLVADNVCGAYGSDAQSEMILPPRDLKRSRTCSSSSSSSWVGVVRGRTRSLTEVATSVKPAAVLSMAVDTQEEGVCLVHVLLAYVEVMR
ncbi:unnamed protein product [Musa acuminata subsp. burmannicoides]